MAPRASVGLKFRWDPSLGGFCVDPDDEGADEANAGR